MALTHDQQRARDDLDSLVARKHVSGSVLKACEALDVLRQTPTPLPLSEFCRLSGMSAPTASRILKSLAQFRLVSQDAAGRYQLGLGLLELGSAVAERLDIVQVSRPHLERLAAQSQETVHLAALEDSWVVYLDKVEGLHSLRLISRPGFRVPVHVTGLGKALLSGLDSEALNSVVNALQTSREPIDLARITRLYAELETTRREGLAYDREEYMAGLTCVAAPVRDREGAAVAAISISGPTFRMQPVLEHVAPSVRQTALDISTDLGFSSSAGEQA